MPPGYSEYTVAEPGPSQNQNARELKAQVLSDPNQDVHILQKDVQPPSDHTLVENGDYDDRLTAQTSVPNRKYEDVANQIVEEERRQRSKASRSSRLENYDFLEKLGEGAFSVVYKLAIRRTVLKSLLRCSVNTRWTQHKSKPS